MVVMFDTGATHNVVSWKAFDRLKNVGVAMQPVKPLVNNLKWVTGVHF